MSISKQIPPLRPSQTSRRCRATTGLALLVAAGLSLGHSAHAQTFTISAEFPHDVTDIALSYPFVDFTDLATFAWKEFVALNFPADPNHRGQPLAGSNIGDSADARVWETYWHRVEVFPYDGLPVQTNGQANVTDRPVYRYSPNALNLTPSTFDSSSTGPMNAQLWNNLDEDSELNLDEMFGRATSPEQFTDENRIVYQAKMNEVGFNYILANQLEQSGPRATMLAGSISGANLQVNGSTCQNASPTVISFPCGANTGSEGHVEIKAAWRALSDAETASGKYYTNEVIHYRADGTVNKWRVDTYGLIGLHIIHKTVNFPAFTFATFEHVDTIGDPANGIATIGYKDEITQSNRGSGDTFPSSILVTARDNPIPAPIAAVNSTVQAALTGTVWANYQLVGVQAYPSDKDTARIAASADMANANDNSSFFLSNIAIETNEELQNFTGSIEADKPDVLNVWSAGQHYNMGGCMGCHGIAQSQGADFSFLLANAPFNAPEVVGSTVGNITPFAINNYADVEEMFNGYILDNPINIANSPHGAFWNKGYVNFTTGEAYGQKIADCQTPSSANSNIITILQGPLTSAGIPEMPAGGPYFPQEQVDNLAAWIDKGCPE